MPKSRSNSMNSPMRKSSKKKSPSRNRNRSRVRSRVSSLLMAAAAASSAVPGSNAMKTDFYQPGTNMVLHHKAGPLVQEVYPGYPVGRVENNGHGGVARYASNTYNSNNYGNHPSVARVGRVQAFRKSKHSNRLPNVHKAQFNNGTVLKNLPQVNRGLGSAYQKPVVMGEFRKKKNSRTSNSYRYKNLEAIKRRQRQPKR